MANRERICQTIEDVKELLGDYNVSLGAVGTTVVFDFPDPQEPSESDLATRRFREKPEIENDPPDLKFARKSHNAIINLVTSPEFWRKTTVADQLTRFYQSAGKPFGIVKMTKRSGELLTMHFSIAEQATKFVQVILS